MADCLAAPMVATTVDKKAAHSVGWMVASMADNWAARKTVNWVGLTVAH